VATALLAEARHAAVCIEDGISLLADAGVLDAFRLMNRALPAAASKRRPGETPHWYPFQLAFILLNLQGLVSPRHDDREIVDLLFFPTGGKVGAYLGLAASVMVWPRLSHSGLGGYGLAALTAETGRVPAGAKTRRIRRTCFWSARTGAAISHALPVCRC
jgi:hypothetical protein